MSYKLDENKLKQIQSAAYEAMEKTGYSILADVDEQQTIPFLTGTMDRTGDVKPSGRGFKLIYSTPYVEVQYFKPMNHYRGHHANATDHWLDPYCNGGTRQRWTNDTFSKHVQKSLKRGR